MGKTWSDFGIDIPNRGGAERYTTCPRCSSQRRKENKRHPCLSVNVEKEVWFCHHCGWTGTLKTGADSGQFKPTWKTPEFILPHYDASKGISPEALAWFEKRGIQRHVLERNRITTGKAFMPQLDDFATTIQFPFYRDGACINIKHRAHPKHFRMEGRAERTFYGLDDIQHSEFCVIVEGELDKLALEAAGVTTCVSVPDGAPSPDAKNYDSKFDFLENSKKQIEHVKQFVIAVDNDAPGRKLEEELTHRLGKHRCAIVRWPTPCKDANDMLLKHGPDELSCLVYNAEPPPIPGVVRVRDMTERLERYYEEGAQPGLHPGWDSLAKHYRVSPAEWTLVTGIPGHGKSELLDALLVNMANAHDWRFAIYSPENSNLEMHISKVLEKQVGKPFRGFGSWDRMDRAEMLTAASWMDEHFHFLDIENEDNLKLDRILELTKELIFQHGIKGLVIDPWNEVDHQRPGNTTETDYISYCLSKVRNFTKHYSIHVWIVAHPTKMQKDAKGNYPVPTPYDVSGSSNWRNKAFNCLSVWRDMTDDNAAVEVHIQKIKFKKNGKVGKVSLRYDTVTGRYSEIRNLF